MVKRHAASEPRNARSLAGLLAPTVGWKKSHEAVDATLRRLGYDGDRLSPEKVTKVLEDLAMEEGMVGVTARVILSRANADASRPAFPSPPVPQDDSLPASFVLAATIGVHEVLAQLSPLLGADKAEAAVQASLRRHALPRDRLDAEQVTRLLDDLGHQDGVVGMAARFARSRVLARFGR
jgi:hypothetical protein